MTNITVGTIPVNIQNSFGSGFTIQNIGTTTIYIGNDTSVAPGNGTPLQGGVSMTVAANAQLYAVVESGTGQLATLTGAESNIATIVNISGTVDVGTVNLAPGTTVGVTGTVDVAGSVAINGNVNLAPGSTVDISGPVNLAAGTSVDIGTISGTVDVNGSNINVVNTPNVNPVVNYTLIASGTYPGGGSTVTLGPYTVGQYQTVIVVLNGNANVLVVPTAMVQLGLSWSNIVALDDKASTLDAALLTLFRRVKTPSLTLVLNSFGSTVPRSMTYTVYGSNQAFPESYVHTVSVAQPAGALTVQTDYAGVSLYSGLPGSSIETFYLSHRAGPASLNVNLTSTTPALNVMPVPDALLSDPAYLFTSNTAGASTNSLVLPNRPIMVQARGSGTGATEFALFQDYAL